jgi:hypothetical protein
VPTGTAADVESNGPGIEIRNGVGGAPQRGIGGRPVTISGGESREIDVSRGGSPSRWPGSSRRYD